ncbi:MAG: BMP family protein, partial [Anaerolineaceae bacterium]|nr:BMP family protein [Anaerolineaceae bacterium]
MLAVAACSPAAPAAPTDAPKKAEDFKVGLLSPGPVNDQGWNQMAYDALKQMESKLGVKTSYVELSESPAEFEKAFRDYANQGYQMVLGHGSQFQDAAIAVAKDFPNTYFFLSGSRYDGPAEGNPNVIGLNIESSQAFYVFGVIAAKMGKGGGVIGGQEIPPIVETTTGFTNGAKSVDPNFKVSITYLGNWTDIAAAKEAAISMVDGGVDFLLADANIAGNGVYQAIGEKGVWGFGTYISADQANDFSMAPGHILANYVNDYGAGLVNIAEKLSKGGWTPEGNIGFGLKDSNVLYITYNDSAENPIPADVKQAAEEAIKKITSGEVN